MFEVGRQLPPRVSGAACALASSAVAALALCRVAAWPQLTELLLPLLFGVGLAVPWGAGALLRLRADALARQRNQLVARAVEQERRALMRELHDVAGHALAVAAMQAGVALVALDSDPDQARKSMDAVQLASSRALGELRSLLRSVAGPVRPRFPNRADRRSSQPAAVPNRTGRGRGKPVRRRG